MSWFGKGVLFGGGKGSGWENGGKVTRTYCALWEGGEEGKVLSGCHSHEGEEKGDGGAHFEMRR